MAPPWSRDGIDTVPRRPRSEYIKRKRGDAWAAAAKKVKLEDSDEDDQEQEALEALFSLAGGVPDFAGDQGLVARVKVEEPSKPAKQAVHNSSGRHHEGRIQRRQRSSPRDDDDRDWAPSKEPTTVRSSIAAPKAVKPSTSNSPTGPASMPVPPASKVGLGTGMGAFAGPFPVGINGSYYAQAGPASAPQATSPAQGGVWPSPAPFLGGIRRDDVAETAGSGQDVLMPPQRRTWKRCASHVYIAHFIEYQLHIERIQKQQQAHRIVSRSASMDGPQANSLTNGDHVPISAATLKDRMGSGSSGSKVPEGQPKHVTPLQNSAASQSLALGNGLGQGMASNPLALPFPQAASMAFSSMQSLGSGQMPQPNGFTPQYAQQLQSQLLMQQGASFPFLNQGLAQFGGSRTGGMSAQQLAAFPFPGSPHMLGLAGFAALGQQLNGNSNGFAPPTSEMQAGMSADMGALKRAAMASMKPEDAMKLGLSGLSNPEANSRLHALGIPQGLLSSARNPSGSLGGPSFHEQLLAATSAQRPESQGVPLMR